MPVVKDGENPLEIILRVVNYNLVTLKSGVDSKEQSITSFVLDNPGLIEAEQFCNHLIHNMPIFFLYESNRKLWIRYKINSCIFISKLLNFYTKD